MSSAAAAGKAQRVFEILDVEKQVEESPDAVSLKSNAGGGHVYFGNVSFGYDSDCPVLQNITLEARPGQTVALVGATGAGKSTLVSLIPRLFDPWQGQITLDGHDLRQLKIASLRSQISLVLQDPYLFPMTIAENIAYGRPEASFEDILSAAKAAHADEFIRDLVQGYDTMIGERGVKLSGGQKQRLAIARALLKDAPVLILDEPTAALDAQTETMLMQALERLMAGRTVIIIAHRLSTIRKADLIVVLKAGKIVEQGSHQELLDAKGAYYQLHHLGCKSNNDGT